MAPTPSLTQGQRLAPTFFRGEHAAAVTTRSTSWSDTDRTFEFVLATDTPVRTYRRDEDWNRVDVDEQLVISGIQNLDGLRGQPILDSHWRGTIDNVVGVIESARIEGNSLVCKGRLADVESVSEIAVKIRDGILTNMSVGFEILEETRSVRPGNADLIQVTKWRALEASLVAVPADANANIRSHQRENSMTDKPNPGATAAAPAAAAVPAVDPAVLSEAIRTAVETALGTRAAAPAQPSAPAAPAQAAAPVADAGVREAAIPSLRAIAERRGFVEDFDDLVALGEPLEALRSIVRGSIETRSEESSTLGVQKAPEGKARLLSFEETTVGKRAAGKQ